MDVIKRYKPKIKESMLNGRLGAVRIRIPPASSIAEKKKSECFFVIALKR